MTDSFSRRAEAAQAIREHLQKEAGGNWKAVRERFPDIPEATFWRMIRRERQAATGDVKIAEARRRLADHASASIQSQAEADAALAEAGASAPSDVVGLRGLDVLGRLEQTFADIDMLRAYALTTDGKVGKPLFFAQSIALKDRSLNTAVKVAEAVMDMQRTWDFFDLIVSEVAAESPEAARRIISRLKERAAIG
jgi:hypothetical protein